VHWEGNPKHPSAVVQWTTLDYDFRYSDHDDGSHLMHTDALQEQTLAQLSRLVAAWVHKYWPTHHRHGLPLLQKHRVALHYHADDFHGDGNITEAFIHHHITTLQSCARRNKAINKVAKKHGWKVDHASRFASIAALGMRAKAAVEALKRHRRLRGHVISMEELRHNATFSDEARMKLAGMEQRHRRRTGQVPHETKQLGQAGDVAPRPKIEDLKAQFDEENPEADPRGGGSRPTSPNLGAQSPGIEKLRKQRSTVAAIGSLSQPGSPAPSAPSSPTGDKKAKVQF